MSADLDGVDILRQELQAKEKELSCVQDFLQGQDDELRNCLHRVDILESRILGNNGTAKILDTDLDNPPTNACLPTSDAGADGELPAEDRMMNDVAIAPPRTHELQAGVSSGNGTHAINCCRSEESTISNLDHSTLITPEQCYTHGLPSILPARSILATPRRSPTVQKNTTTSAFALCQCKCNRSTGVEGRIEAVDVAEHKAKAMDSAEETQRALDEVKRLRVDVRELVKWRDAVQKVKEMMEAAEALNEARQCTDPVVWHAHWVLSPALGNLLPGLQQRAHQLLSELALSRQRERAAVSSAARNADEHQFHHGETREQKSDTCCGVWGSLMRMKQNVSSNEAAESISDGDDALESTGNEFEMLRTVRNLRQKNRENQARISRMEDDMERASLHVTQQDAVVSHLRRQLAAQAAADMSHSPRRVRALTAPSRQSARSAQEISASSHGRLIHEALQAEQRQAKSTMEVEMVEPFSPRHLPHRHAERFESPAPSKCDYASSDVWAQPSRKGRDDDLLRVESLRTSERGLTARENHAHHRHESDAERLPTVRPVPNATAALGTPPSSRILQRPPGALMTVVDISVEGNARCDSPDREKSVASGSNRKVRTPATDRLRRILYENTPTSGAEKRRITRDTQGRTSRRLFVGGSRTAQGGERSDLDQGAVLSNSTLHRNGRESSGRSDSAEYGGTVGVPAGSRGIPSPRTSVRVKDGRACVPTTKDNSNHRVATPNAQSARIGRRREEILRERLLRARQEIAAMRMEPQERTPSR